MSPVVFSRAEFDRDIQSWTQMLLVTNKQGSRHEKLNSHSRVSAHARFTRILGLFPNDLSFSGFDVRKYGWIAEQQCGSGKKFPE